jgi:hypothetical protein
MQTQAKGEESDEPYQFMVQMDRSTNNARYPTLDK